MSSPDDPVIDDIPVIKDVTPTGPLRERAPSALDLPFGLAVSSPAVFPVRRHSISHVPTGKYGRLEPSAIQGRTAGDLRAGLMRRLNAGPAPPQPLASMPTLSEQPKLTPNAVSKPLSSAVVTTQPLDPVPSPVDTVPVAVEPVAVVPIEPSASARVSPVEISPPLTSSPAPSPPVHQDSASPVSSSSSPTSPKPSSVSSPKRGAGKTRIPTQAVHVAGRSGRDLRMSLLRKTQGAPPPQSVMAWEAVGNPNPPKPLVNTVKLSSVVISKDSPVIPKSSSGRNMPALAIDDTPTSDSDDDTDATPARQPVSTTVINKASQAETSSSKPVDPSSSGRDQSAIGWRSASPPTTSPSWEPTITISPQYQLPPLSSFKLDEGNRKKRMYTRSLTPSGAANSIPPRIPPETPSGLPYAAPFETIEHGHPRWALSTEVKSCQHCGRGFTMLMRKHHCRACGSCVCQSCSPYKTNGTGLRLCRRCKGLERGSVFDSHPDPMLLIDAVLAGDVLEVETRLSQFATDANACHPRTGWTPLHAAAYVRSDELVRLLLKFDCDVNQVDFFGASALHVAARRNAVAVCSTLIKAGVEQGIIDSNGNTAWHVASDYRSASVLPLLAEQFTRPVFPPPEELSITEIGQAYSAPTPPLVLPNRPRLKERGLEVLDAAAQALQANLMAVEDEERKLLNEWQWRFDFESLSLRTKWEEIGFADPNERHMGREHEGAVTSQVWKLGHVFPEEDVDIGDAVNAVWLEMEQARRQQEPY